MRGLLLAFIFSKVLSDCLVIIIKITDVLYFTVPSINILAFIPFKIS